MITSSHARLLGLVLVLTSVLPACATYSKCGFKGCPGDAEITAQVEAALKQHTALQIPRGVHVQTLDHVVYLTGMVDTGLERSIAESTAKDVPGVTKVVNSISVRNNTR